MSNQSLGVGSILYHKNQGRMCTIKQVLDSDFIVELDEPIENKSLLKLPKSHLGKFLFFKQSHIGLPYELLVNLDNYRYGGYDTVREVSSNNEAIERVLSLRKILYLVHFTRLENLGSILAYGFVPRNLLDQSDLNYYLNDNYRLDGKKNCTCFSVEFPNSFLFKRFRDYDPSSKWVVILVDAKLLSIHRGKIYYCYNNAARSDIRFKLASDELSNENAFEHLFHEEEHYFRSSGCGTIKRSCIPNMRCFLPTSEQAEILISGVIPRKYIKHVIFKTEEERQRFFHQLPPERPEMHYSDDIFIVNNLYFLRRCDVIFNERGN